jgi:regulator of replication initiation timing
MGKKELNTQIEVLKRTAANASEKVKELTTENDCLRRDNMLLIRAADAGDKHDSTVMNAHLALAKEASACAANMAAEMDNVAAGFAIRLHNLRADVDQRIAEIPGPGTVSDDDLAFQMKHLVIENKMLRDTLATERDQNMKALEELAHERVNTTLQKDIAVRTLAADREVIKEIRTIISKVARRLPRNWKEMGTPSALSAAIAKQAPNMAVAILSDLMEIFWNEHPRMKTEQSALPTEDSTSAMVLDKVDKIPNPPESDVVLDVPKKPKTSVKK